MMTRKRKADACKGDEDADSGGAQPKLLLNDGIQKVQKDETIPAGCRNKKVIDEVNQVYFQKMMEVIAENGNLKSLSIPYYKAYLRKHGLRLSGTKVELLDRIKQHLQLKRGQTGEYDESTFKIECTDVLVGDVIMFKQEVYSSYDHVKMASREPLGERLVAGRVVKEAYRGIKQQQTFTIEVLRSYGYQVLEPLSLLQIKGCILYESRVYRQGRENESLREEVLEETHIMKENTSLSFNTNREGDNATMAMEGIEGVNNIVGNENDCPQELVQESVFHHKGVRDSIMDDAQEQVLRLQPQPTIGVNKKSRKQPHTIFTTSKFKKTRRKKKQLLCSRNECRNMAAELCTNVMCGDCCSRQFCKRHKRS